MAKYATTEDLYDCRCGVSYAFRAEYITHYHRATRFHIPGPTKQCPDKCYKYHTAHIYKCPNCDFSINIINLLYTDYAYFDSFRMLL